MMIISKDNSSNKDSKMNRAITKMNNMVMTMTMTISHHTKSRDGLTRESLEIRWSLGTQYKGSWIRLLITIIIIIIGRYWNEYKLLTLSEGKLKDNNNLNKRFT